MGKSTEMDVKVKFGLKSFITVVAILLAVLIFVFGGGCALSVDLLVIQQFL